MDKKPLLFQVHRFFWKTIDFIYPPVCAGCGQIGERFCFECYQKVIPLERFNTCPKCGYPIQSDHCPYCASHSYVFHAIKSWGIYNHALRKAIHKLKFKRDMGLGDEFSPFLKNIVRKSDWNIDLITPVPISSPTRNVKGI